MIYKSIIEMLSSLPTLPKSQWFYEEKYEVYLRSTFTCIDDKLVPVITISNICVKEEFRNEGVFKTFLKFIEDNIDKNYFGITFENVHNPILSEFIKKLGYQPFKYINCYYKPTK